MNRRPLAVTVIGFVFIATGVIGGVFHAAGAAGRRSFQLDDAFVFALCLTAVVCGLYLLRRNNWARWLAVAWLAYHVVLSVFHSRFQLAVHALLLAVIAYCLFMPRANEYFRRATG